MKTALLRWLRREPPAKADASRERLMAAFCTKYDNFKTLLESNAELLKIIADVELKLGGQAVFGDGYIEAVSTRAVFHTGRMIQCFERMSDRPWPRLREALAAIQEDLRRESPPAAATATAENVLAYDRLSRASGPAVGPKNANIGEVRNRVGLPTPDGFAVTTAAFHRFITHNRLETAIERHKQKLDIYETETIVQVSREIRERLTAAEVPPEVGDDIDRALAALAHRAGDGPLRLALRSSAIGEDASLSFAGQYLSRLNVSPENILDAYKEIVASLFAARAIAYRLHMGFPFREAAMAVACQQMIPAAASGVLYTRDPVDPLQDRILIRAVWGLGPYAVDGVVTPDRYTFSKENPPRCLALEVAEKPVRLIAEAGQGVREAGVAADRRAVACLDAETALRLAGWGMRLERHFDSAQDVEWALAEDGRLVVLQARPLRLDPLAGQEVNRNRPPEVGFEIVAEDGEVACPGVGAGPVCVVRSEADLMAFPDGAVLVSAHTSPNLVMVMDRARAILSDAGNIAGHMSSLAREYMVPTLLNLGDVTRRLSPGEEVTVDAYGGRVYRGRVESLLDIAPPRPGATPGTPEHRALRRRADRIVPLHLVDPKSPRFAPEHCRTVHDIMRFIHEKSYGEIFQLGDLVTERGRLSVRLQASIPIDLFLIDLGGGLHVDATRTASVTVDQVASAPFAALLQGMLHVGRAAREPRPVNLGGFFSVMSRQMLSSPQLDGGRFGDRSYAIVSDVYLNFSSRVGYHYSILDCYCGRTRAKNHINFEFKGGAADDVRRRRRVRVIERVLGELGFLVDTLGDRVTARLAKQEAPALLEKLDQLGRLLIYTRQMDMLMDHDGLVSQMADCFLAGNYALDPRHPPVRTPCGEID